VPDKELQDAIDKARKDHLAAPAWTGRVTPRAGHPAPAPAPARPPLPMDAAAVAARQARLIEAGGGEFDPLADPARAAEGSNPPWPEWALSPAGDTVTSLSAMYDPSDLLYIGTLGGRRELQPKFIRPAAEWIEFFSARLADGGDPAKLGRCFPFICCNPLTGQAAESGSFRCDAAVAAFRYVVLEHDTLELNRQMPLLRGLELPLASLVFSGGRSVHALLDMAAYCGEIVGSLDQWRHVVGGLFEVLKLYGFDTQNCNPSRLTRLPGVIRPPATTAARPSIPMSALALTGPKPPPPPAPPKWQRLLFVRKGARA